MRKKRKNYSPKTKKEAMRLIFEENFSPRQVAEQIGCSLNTIKTWKAQHKQLQSTGSATPKQAEQLSASQRLPKDQQAIELRKPRVTHEEFVRHYWDQGTRAVDVLLLPSEIGQKVVQYVNEALKYAYDKQQ